jgi:hypothetical protein
VEILVEVLVVSGGSVDDLFGHGGRSQMVLEGWVSCLEPLRKLTAPHSRMGKTGVSSVGVCLAVAFGSPLNEGVS